ncbi:MAG: STAS domain-containing protein [Alphaproteobacteria bacterium]|nr:STAS domain-containing protein [Alphaproteobacteria bacterium]
MIINKETKENTLVLSLEGNLDTTTAPDLEAELENVEENITSIVFNFEKLKYISSSGLRILLSTHKKMIKKGGSILIKSINDEIKEVLEITGLSTLLPIE